VKRSSKYGLSCVPGSFAVGWTWKDHEGRPHDGSSTHLGNLKVLICCVKLMSNFFTCIIKFSKK